MAAKRIGTKAKARLLDLVANGASIRAAARKVGISHVHAGRIVAASGQPFTGLAQPKPPPNIPVPDWSSDQPPPPPRTLVERPGYHDRGLQASAAPLAFDGWDIDRIREAISLHRQGLFLESSQLAIAILSFAPVLAAIGQRISPALALPRRVKAGSRGLARVLGAVIESQIAPADGLMPSPYFPQTLWGGMGFDLAFAGFSILQHALGEPDEEDGVRPIYTRRWPTWATTYYRYRNTFVANTTDGPVDVLNDGKFTLVADNAEPHFLGAIVALAEEALDGKSTQRARASWIDRYGNPKWVGTLPVGVAVRSPEGQAFFEALSTIRGPDGFGALPAGAGFEIKGLSGQQSGAFKDALESNLIMVAMALLGQDATMSSGTGGVYKSPTYEGVARRLVDRDLKAMVRGVNQGHVRAFLDFNFATSIAEAKGWVDPVIDIPLPDPDADARIKSYSDRVLAFHKIVQEEKTAGFLVDQERANAIAAALDIAAPTLADPKPKGEIFEYHITNKLVSPDEVRSRIDLPPLPDGVGSIDQLAKERAAGKDKVGTGSGTKSGWGNEGTQSGGAPAADGVAAPTGGGGSPAPTPAEAPPA